MQKNVSGQKLTVFAWDSATGLPKVSDAANITAYRDIDDGGVTVLTDTSATEKDSTNAKGYYIFDLSQAETNGDKILFSAKSSTSGIVVVAVPAVVYTTPNRFSSLVIDAAGLADANTVKVGPTGSGTAQTARDIGASVVVASINADAVNASAFATDAVNEIRNAITGYAGSLNLDASGNVKVSDGTGANQIDTTLGAIAHVILCDTATTLTNDESGVTTLLSRLSSTRAGYLDNLSAGAVATAAALAALNNLSAAQVNAEVVDALNVDTYAEPSQGAPGATISLASKLSWLYASWRNKKDNDGTTTNLYADNGTTVLAKQTTALNTGVVSKAEWITGA